MTITTNKSYTIPLLLWSGVYAHSKLQLTQTNVSGGYVFLTATAKPVDSNSDTITMDFKMALAKFATPQELIDEVLETVKKYIYTIRLENWAPEDGTKSN